MRGHINVLRATYYVEINQLNALNYILLYFTMASTCFGKTVPSYDLSPTILKLNGLRKEHSRSLRMALFCRNM
jgi:hypothetical protein